MSAKAGKGRSSVASGAATLAARGVSAARRVDWQTVMIRARWLGRHSKRLYDNLSEAERKEFFSLMVRTRGRPTAMTKADRDRLRDLVSKAVTGS